MLENRTDFTGNGNKECLAKRIREIRKAKGWTQPELAKKLYVSRNTISGWETENCMPSLDNVIAIADATGISVDALLGREGLSKEETVPEKEYVEKLMEIEKKIQEFTELIQAEKRRMRESAQ